MLRNYIKIAFRTLARHKGISLINIAGLAIGIAACSLIMLYVNDELNFDSFHEKADRIYRVVETRQSPDQGERHIAMTAGPVGQALIDEFPEVVAATRFIMVGRFTVQHGDRRFYEGDYLIAEPDVFDIFDFKMLKGNPETALSEPGSVVLTEKAARKYFGQEDPLGKTLLVSGEDEVKVTGLLADPPPNSHLDFSMLFPFADMTSERWQEFVSSWDSDYFITYILLNQQQNIAGLESKLNGFMQRHRGENAEEAREIYLQPLTDIHFRSGQIEFDRNQAKGDISYIYIFSAIAIFVALIACINYMNLATARSISRAREVGMRKVIGAQRRQLIAQFLGESVIVALLASLLAMAVIQLILPEFNQFTEKELAVSFGAGTVGIAGILLIALVVGIISGSYPALILSRLRPAAVLKGKMKTSAGAAWLREGLVVTQFVLSIFMIIATMVVHNQLQYVQEKRLGFNLDHLVVIDINSGSTRSNFEAMKTEFAKVPGVQSVCVSSRVPGEWKELTEVEVARGDAPDTDVHTMNFIGIDADFIPTYQMELLAGENFSRNHALDSASVIINEAAVSALGLENPLGKHIRIPGANFRPRIIGVVKDFHFQSLHEKIGPLVLGYWSNPVRVIDYFTARIGGGSIPATLKGMQAVHEEFDQITPFEYNFLDEKLSRYYETDLRVGKLVGIAAALAIVIACLGLFGLAAFSAEQRTKEIGIRKVLGASVSNIVLLLSKDFSRLVLVAAALSIPLAYYAMSEWLQNFAYRVDIGIGVFALAAVAALLISWLTIGWQAVKSALNNPVETLRYE